MAVIAVRSNALFESPRRLTRPASLAGYSKFPRQRLLFYRRSHRSFLQYRRVARRLIRPIACGLAGQPKPRDLRLSNSLLVFFAERSVAKPISLLLLSKPLPVTRRGREHVLDAIQCTWACTGDFSNCLHYPPLMKAELPISIKEYDRNKNLKITLHRTPFRTRPWFVRMNGQPL